MASRTSTLVQATKGALLYHNNSSKAQLVTIHGVSNTSTANPAVTIVLNTGNDAQLNYEKQQFTVGTAGNTVSLGIGTGGLSAFANTQNSYSYLGDTSGSSFKGNNDYYDRYLLADPWMFVKPSEYGNKDDKTLAYVGTMSNQYAGAWNNIYNEYKAGTYSIADILGGGLDSTTSNADNNPSYVNRGIAYDQYTQTFVTINNSSYMSCGVYRQAVGGWQVGNRTSNSAAYSYSSGSYDPQSYPVSGSLNNSWSPALSADGGIFAVNYGWGGNSQHRTVFIPGGRAIYKGVLPTDHSKTSATTVPLTSGITMTDFCNASGTQVSYVYSTNDDEFQWLKYNKAIDKYYVCFKSGSGNGDHAGIWSFDYDQSTDNAWTEGGTAGGGPNGARVYNSNWTKEEDYPVVLSRRVTIPAKVGSSLWLMYDDTNVAYFSEDLISWTAADTFLDSGYVIKNQDASGLDFFHKSDGSVVTVTAGIAEMNQAGLLEKSTAIGNYTRNGLVLGPNDSLYVENENKSTNISFTVTEVEI